MHNDCIILLETITYDLFYKFQLREKVLIRMKRSTAATQHNPFRIRTEIFRLEFVINVIRCWLFPFYTILITYST